MEIHNIAIVGLGRVGTAFLEKALDCGSTIKVKAVCEIDDTPGRRIAEENAVPLVEPWELADFGVELDVLFDLTGDPNVSRAIEDKLEKAQNSHTQVAPVRVARLVWSLLAGDDYLPDVGRSKYQVYADMLLQKAKA